MSTPSGSDVKRRSRLPLFLVVRKLGVAAGTLVFAVIINFFLFRMLPGDPAKAFAPRGRNSDPGALREIRERMGLDEPLFVQFRLYLNQLVHGDLGVSWSKHAKVTEVIADRIGPTVLLSGTALLLASVIGVWLGARQGWRSGSWFDRITSSTALNFYSVPEWLLGLVLLVVLAKVDFVPADGGMSGSRSELPYWLDVAWHMALPVAVLTIVYIAEYSMIMRSSILDERHADYLTTARAKGLRDALVLRRHAMPNALLPSMTLFFLSLGFVIAGAITVETVFSWPGLGRLTYEALRGPDVPLLQGLFLIFSAAVILMNLIADLLIPVLDPRVGRS